MQKKKEIIIENWNDMCHYENGTDAVETVSIRKKYGSAKLFYLLFCRFGR